MATSKIGKRIAKQTFTKSGLPTSTYYASGTIDISKPGYTPISVTYGTTVALMHFAKCLINGNELEWTVSMNQSTNPIPGGVLSFEVTYAKL